MRLRRYPVLAETSFRYFHCIPMVNISHGIKIIITAIFAVFRIKMAFLSTSQLNHRPLKKKKA